VTAVSELCGVDLLQLTVVATGNESLAPERAILTVTVAGRVFAEVSMKVDGPTAIGGVAQLPVGALIEWWVVAASMDGDTDQTDPAGPGPCSPE
jgi:hypothetical protein